MEYNKRGSNMSDLFIQILPLAVASAASPVIIAISLALLSKKSFGALGAFFFGCALATLILAGIGISVAAEDEVVASSIGLSTSVLDLALGAVFFAFGVKVMLEKPADEKNPPPTKKPRSPISWFALGLFGSLTNFDAAILNITAVREIFNSNIVLLQKAFLLVFCDFFLLSPILLPCIIYVFAPAASKALLAPVADWLKKNGNYLVGAIFIIFGIFLVMKGI